jgi:hypothetical protein
VTLDEHFAGIVEEYRQSRKAPLSARKALLVAVLLDHFADRVFARFRADSPERVFGAEDLPAWRDAVAARSDAVATVFALSTGRSDAHTLRIDTVTVPIVNYAALSVEDYMVSLYNRNSVQRVMIVAPDGKTVLAHELLEAALAYWEGADWR